MRFANLFKARTRLKCFVYRTFATVSFAKSGSGSREGVADHPLPTRPAFWRRSSKPSKFRFIALSILLFSVLSTVAAGDDQPSTGGAAHFTTKSTTTPSVNYRQGNYAVPQIAQSTINVSFTAAQASSDLNVVVVGWRDSTAVVKAVTDTSGNTYAVAAGPTIQSGSLSQCIYYAKNIVAAPAGANVVTVTFTAAAQYPDVRILEYSGADLNNPVDVTAARAGNGSTSRSGAATTTNPTDLIFGANLVKTNTSGPGNGFTLRIDTSPDGDITEDRMVTSTGSHGVSAPLSSAGPWVMQMVAFRTASAGGDTTPPTAPTNLTATAISQSQINLSWTASTDNVGVTGYLVERCTGAGCANFTQVATPTSTSYSDGTLSASTAYSYRVRAADAAGNLSTYSNVAATTTPAAALGSLSANPSSVSFGNVAFGNSKTAPIVLSNTGNASATISQANVSGNAFSISGLSMPYTLAAGQNTSLNATFTPGTFGAATGSISIVSNAVNSPLSVALSGIGTHTVTVSWQASTSTVAGYNVYRGATSGGPYTKLNSSLVAATSYVDGSVQAGQTYYYVATAVDGSNNESVHSNQATAAVPSP
jgi:fibronectin type 3 domain-containing protein